MFFQYIVTFFFIFTIVWNIFSNSLFTIHYTFRSKIIKYFETLPFASIIYFNHNNIKISGQEKPVYEFRLFSTGRLLPTTYPPFNFPHAVFFYCILWHFCNFVPVSSFSFYFTKKKQTCIYLDSLWSQLSYCAGSFIVNAHAQINLRWLGGVDWSIEITKLTSQAMW